jgi:hypothetical protein
MAERGIILSYEAVQYWRRKFGRAYAKRCAAGLPDMGTTGPWMKSFSLLGGRSQAQPWSYKGRAQEPRLYFYLVISSRRIILTMPTARPLSDRNG